MKRLGKIQFAAIFALIATLFGTPSVRAEWITIAISGQVEYVNDQLGNLQNQVHFGDTISGTYTYDSAIFDSNPSSAVGDYEYSVPPAGIWLTAGGFDFRTNATNVNFLVEILNDDGLLNVDAYLIRSYNNSPLYGNVLVDEISWQLDDSTGTALSSVALPLTAPDMSKWSSNNLVITGPKIESIESFGIRATITSATLVPEPATILMLGFGMLLTRRIR